MKIVPLEGFCIGKPINKLTSIDEESAHAMGMSNFTVVDSKIGRNDALNGRCRVRKFNIIAVYENATDDIKNYEGKNMYCVCMENEYENNIIVDSDTGDKIWFLPVNNILGYDKD